MKTFAQRRARSITLIVIAVFICWIAYRALQVSLAPGALYTGFGLLAIILVLTFFNVRKKLPFIPLMKASTWMQFHIYLGLFSVAVYLFHTSFRIPSGLLESLVAAAFLTVCLSGFAGIYISRTLPKKMTNSGESLIYERLPIFRARSLSEVEKLVLTAEEKFDSSTLADFYNNHAAHFLRRLPGFWLPFRSIDRNYAEVAEQLEDLARYLNEKELEAAVELGEWLDSKRNLDFQWACHRLLKRWLFIHIPLTYSLIILVIVHAWVAISYTSN